MRTKITPFKKILPEPLSKSHEATCKLINRKKNWRLTAKSWLRPRSG